MTPLPTEASQTIEVQPESTAEPPHEPQFTQELSVYDAYRIIKSQYIQDRKGEGVSEQSNQIQDKTLIAMEDFMCANPNNPHQPADEIIGHLQGLDKDRYKQGSRAQNLTQINELQTQLNQLPIGIDELNESQKRVLRLRRMSYDNEIKRIKERRIKELSANDRTTTNPEIEATEAALKAEADRSFEKYLLKNVLDEGKFCISLFATLQKGDDDPENVGSKIFVSPNEKLEKGDRTVMTKIQSTDINNNIPGVAYFRNQAPSQVNKYFEENDVRDCLYASRDKEAGTVTITYHTNRPVTSSYYKIDGDRRPGNELRFHLTLPDNNDVGTALANYLDNNPAYIRQLVTKAITDPEKGIQTSIGESAALYEGIDSDGNYQFVECLPKYDQWTGGKMYVDLGNAVTEHENPETKGSDNKPNFGNVGQVMDNVKGHTVKIS